MRWRGALVRAGFRFDLRRRRPGRESAVQSGGWIGTRRARAAAASAPRRVRTQRWRQA
ncbi:hypothetical protein C4K05_2141 [Pseudomonas chlororaphis subsp. aureofaciens]|uniref:Uncharacterized protein n=1 Tax=Pseudomonas chlororaphis subsp. aureofaciens TaxID=587851 RepID=A0AAD1E597_9PSED|nr:hypothetical protein C4K14_2201 [Pseudomonas chlororaphis subsp. aureofaciens]AZD91515.1 hypothetical protein C4K13_2088 [Pseudomonas chlororaphis subsp. aureofaciens]AZD97967.1 hypothetical protein C4K12_2091 [Pseudomonas chlororaphis subsp. aureofaciens]AZE04223.1 hypothetical protein C4K11_2051 [Pseudomonas chlororaphis subsp. aureofaciens]AZE10364.1 hypothetical protein C4K10_2074 [Pseudomonas chlororaphis subsp. aureofaciens]